METSTSRYRTTPKTTTGRTAKGMTTEQCEQLVRETAYFLAERDSFRSDPVEYWLAAERRINERF